MGQPARSAAVAKPTGTVVGRAPPRPAHGHGGALDSLLPQRAPQLVDTAPLIQPKLEVGPARDRYEEEADRMAAEIMRMQEPSAPGGDGLPSDGRSAGAPIDAPVPASRQASAPAAVTLATSPAQRAQRQPDEDEEQQEELEQKLRRVVLASGPFR